MFSLNENVNLLLENALSMQQKQIVALFASIVIHKSAQREIVDDSLFIL